ncbi:MAG: hypothetical protein ACWGQW_21000 [bacterium]
MNLKAFLTPAIILSLAASAATGAKFYGDHTYVAIDSYQQSVRQQRVWDLMDRINGLKDKAAIENRELTPAEKRQLERWEDEIRKLQ